jgi:hypothetical protein
MLFSFVVVAKVNIFCKIFSLIYQKKLAIVGLIGAHKFFLTFFHTKSKIFYYLCALNMPRLVWGGKLKLNEKQNY